MNNMAIRRTGFTIVELIIVIVVIAILATITLITYGGAQDKARQGTIQSDLRNLVEAIELGRVKTGKTLHDITGSWWTGQYCMFQSSNPSAQIPNGTDFSKRTSMTQACWNDYTSALQKISDASGTDVTNLTDPWKRPYYIDENDDGGTNCSRDALGWLSQPYIGGYAQHFTTYARPSNPTCANKTDTVG
jgi:prepilin-type N-terminal cleavage/methylation domain-containing protein